MNKLTKTAFMNLPHGSVLLSESLGYPVMMLLDRRRQWAAMEEQVAGKTYQVSTLEKAQSAANSK